MDKLQAVETIKQKFAESGSPARIPLLKGGSFVAEIAQKGVSVDNLGTQPFLPWAVFQEAVYLLIRNGGRAMRGDAMGARLGEPDLPLDSVEGHVASAVYGKKPKEAVFRRITPIACILIWAGICKARPGELMLLEKA